MGRHSYRAGEGYRRLPRTIFLTLLAFLLVGAVGVQVTRWRTRQTEYLKLVARCDELEGRYARQSRSDSEVARSAAEDVPNLENLARQAVSEGDARQAASLRKMAQDKGRQAERLSARARKCAEVRKYYASMRQRYEHDARRPWVIATPPSGDALDVEFVFLSEPIP